MPRGIAFAASSRRGTIGGMDKPSNSLLRNALPRFGVLLLFALSIGFTVLYTRSFGARQTATAWTDDFHMLSIFSALAGILIPLGLLISPRRWIISDLFLIVMGVPVFLNSWIVI